MELTWAPDQHVSVTWTEHENPLAPVLVIWPAFGTPATFYRHLTPALAQAGMASVVVEYPGRETRGGVDRQTDYGYDALATSVHTAVIAHVRESKPGAPVFLLGHSLGGHVAVFASALAAGTPAEPDGIILAATASPYWRGYGWRGLPKSFVGTGLMAAVAQGVGYWPGDVFRFWGRQSRVLVTDWSRLARTGRVRPRGATADYEAALRQYTGDVLAISIPDDLFAPIPALERLLAAIPKARVERWHSPTAVGHISWVRRHEEIVPVIRGWVIERVGAPA